MSNKNKIKILIIEDDPTWSLFIESIIAESEYQVAGSANTIEKAKAMIMGLKPNLIISDIRVQSSIIFNVLEESPNENIPIIFMTNHLEDKYYDLSHKYPKSAFLVKPFHKFTLLSALDLLIDKYPVEETQDEPFITVRGKQQQVKKILFNQIAWIRAEGNYTYIFTSKKLTYVKKKTLKEYLENLDSRFLRVHKSYIINQKYVQRIDLGNKQIIVADTIIPIGRGYRSELDPLLEEKN